MLEFFGLDLMDLWRGRLSFRRIGVCIKSLMRKAGRSVLIQSLDESASWTIQEHLLARVIDAQEASNYYFLMANSSEESQGDIPTPEPVRRPGDPDPEEMEPEYEFASGAEVANFFNKMSNL